MYGYDRREQLDQVHRESQPSPKYNGETHHHMSMPEDSFSNRRDSFNQSQALHSPSRGRDTSVPVTPKDTSNYDRFDQDQGKVVPDLSEWDFEDEEYFRRRAARKAAAKAAAAQSPQPAQTPQSPQPPQPPQPAQSARPVQVELGPGPVEPVRKSEWKQPKSPHHGFSSGYGLRERGDIGPLPPKEQRVGPEGSFHRVYPASTEVAPPRNADEGWDKSSEAELAPSVILKSPSPPISRLKTPAPISTKYEHPSVRPGAGVEGAPSELHQELAGLVLKDKDDQGERQETELAKPAAYIPWEPVKYADEKLNEAWEPPVYTPKNDFASRDLGPRGMRGGFAGASGGRGVGGDTMSMGGSRPFNPNSAGMGRDSGYQCDSGYQRDFTPNRPIDIKRPQQPSASDGGWGHDPKDQNGDPTPTLSPHTYDGSEPVNTSPTDDGGWGVDPIPTPVGGAATAPGSRWGATAAPPAERQPDYRQRPQEQAPDDGGWGPPAPAPAPAPGPTSAPAPAFDPAPAPAPAPAGAGRGMFINPERLRMISGAGPAGGGGSRRYDGGGGGGGRGGRGGGGGGGGGGGYGDRPSGFGQSDGGWGGRVSGSGAGPGHRAPGW